LVRVALVLVKVLHLSLIVGLQLLHLGNLKRCQAREPVGKAADNLGIRGVMVLPHFFVKVILLT